jgi:PIN domain nuclease of toxin-antitoxin system
MMRNDPILFLDTCALLWLAGGNPRLTGELLEVVDQADRVYVSPISAWEISLKVERGALALPMEPELWFARVVDHHGLALSPLDVSVMIAANGLPWHHRDPADRFIIASAQRENATIVTADRHFQSYEVKLLVC